MVARSGPSEDFFQGLFWYAKIVDTKWLLPVLYGVHETGKSLVVTDFVP